jgi:uncharacterized tellurite resistance protein B-like protein
MQQEEKLLSDYTDQEKGAYISAIASIASADRSASEEERDFLEELADAADLSEEQRKKVRNAAVNTSDDELRTSLDILKTSDLRFSLLADLISFAESDTEYSSGEKTEIDAIARYLNITPEQVSTINEFVQTAATTEVTEEQVEKQGFLGSLGMDDKLKKAGINSGGMLKGLLGFAGPMILGALLSRGLGGRRGGGGLGGMLGGLAGGGLGGMLGGSGGGLGSILGQGSGGMGTGGLGGMLGGSGLGGGLGSIIGMLNGGRGMKSSGGMLGRMFGR